MLRRILPLLLSAAFLTSLQAQTITAVDVSGLAPGKYVLTLTADSATTVPLKILGTTPGPIPIPPPTNLTDRAVAIRDAAKASTDPNRAATAQNLSDLYREVAKKVRAGEIKTQAVIAQVVTGATDMVLAQSGSSAAWQPTRAILSSQWVKLAQEGGNDAAFAKLLDEAADGLLSSVPANQFASADMRAIDLAKIIEIIMLIMKLLGLIPAAGGGL